MSISSNRARLLIVIVVVLIVLLSGVLFYAILPRSTVVITTSTSMPTSIANTSSSRSSSVSPISTTTSVMSSIISSTSTGTVSTSSGIGIVSVLPPGANYPMGSYYPTGPLFVRFRVVQGNQWTSPQYTANQILSMISQLKPNVLERMTTDAINPMLQVPVCSSCASMDYLQFLNNATSVCRCYIIPRLNINTSFWQSGEFLSIAREILQTNVSPRFTILSVDNWGTFCEQNSCTCSLDQQIFQQLYQMGWKGIGVLNAAAPYYGTCGWTTFTDFDTGGNSGAVNQNLLSSIQSDKTQQKILLYDPDFPGQAQKWLAECNPTCDSQITDLQMVVSQQSSTGYTYVYPVEQTFWDANQINTSLSGPYQGQNLYQIFESWMNQYN